MRPTSRDALALLLVSALAGAGQLHAQVVYGVVTEEPTGAPIPGVRLHLLNADGDRVAATDSDEEGGFELRTRLGGLYSVSAERIGYASFRSDVMAVEDGGRIEVRLRLGVNAIPLSPFVVLADNQIRRGRVADFERRRSDPSIGGHFLGAAEVRARPTATPTQLLQSLPAVDLYQVQTVDNPYGLDRNLIYLPGSRGGSLRSGRCLAQVFVNGVPVRQTQDGHVTVDDLLDGVPIVGVELYTRASAAPAGFGGTGECGVVMYWTEEPTPSSGSWSAPRIAVGLGAILGILIAGFVG